jgi:predicted membrane protein
MNNNLTDVEQRIKRYWYVDGFGELMGGGMFLLLGLYFSAQQYFGDQSLVGIILQSSFAVILIGGLVIARKLINALKMRYTYPRTGYVEYEKKNGIQRRTLAMAAAIVIAMVSVIIARRLDAIDAMVAITGVLVAIVLVVKQGWSSKVRRFYVLSFASLLLGIALSVSGLPRGYNLGAFYGLMGTAFAISGAITLTRYLRENPLPSENQHD